MAIASEVAEQRPRLRLVVDAPSLATEVGCDPGAVICSCRTHEVGPGPGGIAGRRDPQS
jgi:hypothetical protein